MRIPFIKSISGALVALALLSGSAQARSLDENMLEVLKGRHKDRIVMGLPGGVLLTMFFVQFEKTENEIIAELSRLLSQGGNIDYQEESKATDSEGRRQGKGSRYTALMYAAYEGYPRVVRFLVEKGADTNLEELWGWNAYQLAEYYRDQYENYSRDNEKQELTEGFTEESKQRRRELYADYARRYDQIACYLKPKTNYNVIPWSWSSILYYNGNIEPSCGWQNDETRGDWHWYRNWLLEIYLNSQELRDLLSLRLNKNR